MQIKKILKKDGTALTELEQEVNDAMAEISMHSEYLTSMQEIYATRVREVKSDKKSMIIYIPVPLQKRFQKIQVQITSNLEKKFSGSLVFFVSDRRILMKPRRGHPDPNKQKRPRSRTLTAVYNEILADLVFPAEILGKRVHCKQDGSFYTKVFLDVNQKPMLEVKLPTISEIYKKITGIELFIEFTDLYH